MCVCVCVCVCCFWYYVLFFEIKPYAHKKKQIKLIKIADAGTRFMFDFTKHGMIPCGGLIYRIALMPDPLVGFWYVLTGQPMSAWEAHECGLVDWMMPSNNHVLSMTHIGNDCDSVFRTVFADQVLLCFCIAFFFGFVFWHYVCLFACFAYFVYCIPNGKKSKQTKKNQKKNG